MLFPQVPDILISDTDGSGDDFGGQVSPRAERTPLVVVSRDRHDVTGDNLFHCFNPLPQCWVTDVDIDESDVVSFAPPHTRGSACVSDLSNSKSPPCLAVFPGERRDHGPGSDEEAEPNAQEIDAVREGTATNIDVARHEHVPFPNCWTPSPVRVSSKWNSELSRDVDAAKSDALCIECCVRGTDKCDCVTGNGQRIEEITLDHHRYPLPVRPYGKSFDLTQPDVCVLQHEHTWSGDSQRQRHNRIDDREGCVDLDKDMPPALEAAFKCSEVECVGALAQSWRAPTNQTTGSEMSSNVTSLFNGDACLMDERIRLPESLHAFARPEQRTGSGGSSHRVKTGNQVIDDPDGKRYGHGDAEGIPHRQGQSCNSDGAEVIEYRQAKRCNSIDLEVIGYQQVNSFNGDIMQVINYRQSEGCNSDDVDVIGYRESKGCYRDDVEVTDCRQSKDRNTGNIKVIDYRQPKLCNGGDSEIARMSPKPVAETAPNRTVKDSTGVPCISHVEALPERKNGMRAPLLANTGKDQLVENPKTEKLVIYLRGPPGSLSPRHRKQLELSVDPTGPSGTSV